jgi:hypothetical protein
MVFTALAINRWLWLALLLDEPFVFVMGSNPNPDDVIPVLHCECPVSNPNSNRPKVTDLFEVERGVSRIFF